MMPCRIYVRLIDIFTQYINHLHRINYARPPLQNDISHISEELKFLNYKLYLQIQRYIISLHVIIIICNNFQKTTLYWTCAELHPFKASWQSRFWFWAAIGDSQIGSLELPLNGSCKLYNQKKIQHLNFFISHC